jgi:serralysin
MIIFPASASEEADLYYGTSASDTMDGGGGNDTIVGMGGDDVIRGGAGNDLLGAERWPFVADRIIHTDYVEPGADVLDGGDGDDLIVHAMGETDTCLGGAGDDTIILGFVMDSPTGMGVIDGGAGQDVVLFQTMFDFGSITFTGIETLRLDWMGVFPYSGAITATVDQLNSFDRIEYVESIVLKGAGGVLNLPALLSPDTGFRGIDATALTSGLKVLMPSREMNFDSDLDIAQGGFGVHGSAYNDTVTGGTLGDLLYGNAGNDKLFGNSGNDSILAGAGNDVLGGIAGTDTLAGGSGDDIYLVDSMSDTVIETAGEGIDTVGAKSPLYTLGANLERLVYTGRGDFTGSGNGLANTLTGGAGDDTLTGGGGRDHLAGGPGADVFRYTDARESVVDAADRIVGFTAGDRIDVEAIDAFPSRQGDQAFVLDALGDTSFAFGHIRQTMQGANVVLDFNNDADPQVEMRIVVLNHGPLTAADFIL